MITLTHEEAQQVLDALEGVFEGDDKGAEFWAVNGGTFEAVYCMNAMRLLRAKISEPEPEPEPVAWLDEEFGLAYTVTELADADGTLFIPLYTSPPQREWQGLTDDERDEIREQAHYEFDDISNAIEAKLKEKNT